MDGHWPMNNWAPYPATNGEICERKEKSDWLTPSSRNPGLGSPSSLEAWSHPPHSNAPVQTAAIPQTFRGPATQWLFNSWKSRRWPRHLPEFSHIGTCCVTVRLAPTTAAASDCPVRVSFCCQCPSSPLLSLLHDSPTSACRWLMTRLVVLLRVRQKAPGNRSEISVLVANVVYVEKRELASQSGCREYTHRTLSGALI